jgi:tetrahydromethanopterin S-methyltransferase subunit F
MDGWILNSGVTVSMFFFFFYKIGRVEQAIEDIKQELQLIGRNKR